MRFVASSPALFFLAYPSREIAAGLWFRGFSARFSFPETAGRSWSSPRLGQTGGGVSDAEPQGNGRRWLSGNGNSNDSCKHVCVTFHCFGDLTIAVGRSRRGRDDLASCTDVENEVRKS